MPCRYDPTPQEIAEGKLRETGRKLAVQEERKQKEALVKQELDHLTQQLCQARSFLLNIALGKTTLEEFKDSVDYPIMLCAHVFHRKADQDRTIKDLAGNLVNTSDEERAAISDRMRDILAVKTDEELITTDLF